MGSNVEYTYKVGAYAWIGIEGVFKRELVVIVEQFTTEGGTLYYRVQYVSGVAEGSQSLVSENKLSKYYG